MLKVCCDLYLSNAIFPSALKTELTAQFCACAFTRLFAATAATPCMESKGTFSCPIPSISFACHTSNLRSKTEIRPRRQLPHHHHHPLPRVMSSRCSVSLARRTRDVDSPSQPDHLAPTKTHRPNTWARPSLCTTEYKEKLL